MADMAKCNRQVVEGPLADSIAKFGFAFVVLDSETANLWEVWQAH